MLKVINLLFLIRLSMFCFILGSDCSCSFSFQGSLAFVAFCLWLPWIASALGWDACPCSDLHLYFHKKWEKLVLLSLSPFELHSCHLGKPHGQFPNLERFIQNNCCVYPNRLSFFLSLHFTLFEGYSQFYSSKPSPFSKFHLQCVPPQTALSG